VIFEARWWRRSIEEPGSASTPVVSLELGSWVIEIRSTGVDRRVEKENMSAQRIEYQVLLKDEESQGGDIEHSRESQGVGGVQMVAV